MLEKTNVRGSRWVTLALALMPVLLGIIGCASVSTTPDASTSTTTTSPATPSVTTQPTTPIAAAGRDESLARRIDAIFDGAGATAAVRVIELPARRELYARDADRPVMPASNMKLVT